MNYDISHPAFFMPRTKHFLYYGFYRFFMLKERLSRIESQTLGDSYSRMARLRGLASLSKFLSTTRRTTPAPVTQVRAVIIPGRIKC